MELKIEYLPVESLKAYDRNARKHEDYDIEAIKNSIDHFEFNDPIAIWGKDNEIVCGHGRLYAAKRLGMETVPCIRLDHLTEEQRRAYALAHNKTAELSGWDFGTLESELGELEEMFNMEDFGFENHTVNPDALDDLFAPAEEKPKNEEPKQIKCPHCGEWFTP